MQRMSARLGILYVLALFSSLLLLIISRSQLTTCPEEVDKEVEKTSSSLEGLHLNLSLGRRDFSGKYVLFDHVIVGDKFRDLSFKYNVTMATQTSLDRFIDIIQLSKRWEGALSISVFVIDIEYSAVKGFIEFLRHCYRPVRENTAFSFVYPVNKPPVSKDFGNYTQYFDQCDSPTSVHEYFTKKIFTESYKKWKESYKYPQNHMRNLARQTCLSSFTLLVDVDIIPTHNLAQQLSQFIKTEEATNCTKCVFVFAAYEAERIPENKYDLLELVASKKAQPFHDVINKACQNATNFTLFEKSLASKNTTEKIHISHTVTNFQFLYEPFYLSLNSVPLFEEKFIGYGFTRNTQTYELHVGGWSFQVLSPVYFIHLGMKFEKKKPDWRYKQDDENRQIYRKFRNEVVARYKDVD